MFALLAEQYGLEATEFEREFIAGGERFRITGIDPRRPNILYPSSVFPIARLQVHRRQCCHAAQSSGQTLTFTNRTSTWPKFHQLRAGADMRKRCAFSRRVLMMPDFRPDPIMPDGKELDGFGDLIYGAVLPAVLILQLNSVSLLSLFIASALLLAGTIRLSYFANFGKSEDGRFFGVPLSYDNPADGGPHPHTAPGASRGVPADGESHVRGARRSPHCCRARAVAE